MKKQERKGDVGVWGKGKKEGMELWLEENPPQASHGRTFKEESSLYGGKKLPTEKIEGKRRGGAEVRRLGVTCVFKWSIGEKDLKNP